MMLGLGDGWVVLAFLGNIGIALVCVIYGILNWNRDGDEGEKGE